MADVICRWRNGTPQTVVELVNSLPHEIMPTTQFRELMQDKWDGSFFRTPYQLACQLGLYYEGEDDNYHPRFNHDINEIEALRYLEYWLPNYYIPNPYVGKNGFQRFDCPTKVLDLFVDYVKVNPDCDFQTAFESIFSEDGVNNSDILRNYIDKFSRVIQISKDGKMSIITDKYAKIYSSMDKNNKKAFFDNFNDGEIEILLDNYKLLPIEEKQKVFYSFLKSMGLSESSCIKYVFQHPAHQEIIDIIRNLLGRESLFEIYDVNQLDLIYPQVKELSGNETQGNSWSATVTNYRKFIDYLNVGNRHTHNEHKTLQDNAPLQQIFYGVPGTGKSNTVKKVTDNMPNENVFRTTFHPDSDYSTFVGCYKPKMVTAPVRDGSGHEVTSATNEEKQRITYEFIPQAFTKAYCRAMELMAEGEPVILVIEEINRGNCAQIFGDIFQLLDRDDNGWSQYPIIPDTDIERYLADHCPAYNPTDGMKLPPNLYIWATMNTSDQSLFPIDSAFKRRWEWKYVPISEGRDKDTHNPLGYKISVKGTDYDWWDFLQKVNDAIGEVTNSEDKKLGYFFCKADENNKISADKFVSKVLFYLFGDVLKDYDTDDVAFTFDNSSYTLLKCTDGDKQGRFKFSDFFDENGNAKEYMVVKFLENINVKKDSAGEYPTEEVDDEGDDSTTKFKRKQFWQGFIEATQSNANYMKIYPSARTATSESFMDLGFGTSLYHPYMTCLFTKHVVRCGIWIYESDNAENIFNAFKNHQAEIETIVGETMEFNKSRKTFKIFAKKDIDINDENNWPEAFEWLMKMSINMNDVKEQFGI